MIALRWHIAMHTMQEQHVTLRYLFVRQDLSHARQQRGLFASGHLCIPLHLAHSIRACRQGQGFAFPYRAVLRAYGAGGISDDLCVACGNA